VSDYLDNDGGEDGDPLWLEPIDSDVKRVRAKSRLSGAHIGLFLAIIGVIAATAGHLLIGPQYEAMVSLVGLCLLYGCLTALMLFAAVHRVDRNLEAPDQAIAELIDKSQGDRLLAERRRSGEVAAWQEFFDRFNGPLCAEIRGILGPDSSDLSLVNEIASRVWYALVHNDGELLERFDPARHVRLGTFLRDLARIEITECFRPKY